MEFALNPFIILVICILVTENAEVNAEEYITVWEHPNSQGVSENLCVSHCSNIRHPRNIKLVSSINLQGNCARFYDQFNCSGKSFEVLPNSPSHNHMVDWNLDDRSRSVGPCRNECAIDVTGTHNKENIKVQLFNKPNFIGNDATLVGTGCLSLRNSFIDQVKSIKTFGQCIELYNNPTCVNSGTNMTSIELRQDTYFHNDLSKWKFPKVMSVSHCRYKCDVVTRPLKIQEVTLFDQVNYAGSWIKLTFDKCVNLSYQWEMGAQSLEIGGGTCAEIYEDLDCSGQPFVINSSSIDLLTNRENLPIRSIGICLERKYVSKTSMNLALYFTWFAVILLIFATLVLAFVLGNKYSLIKRSCLSQSNENEITESVPGYDMEIHLKENNENSERMEKNLVNF